MIIATLIASLAAVTIAGTWLGLRFAERAETTPSVDAEERRRALADVERCMTYGNRDEVRAMLACRPHVLPPDVRARVAEWSRP